MLDAHKTIHVAVGVILSNQQVLIAQRPTNTHLAGYWEFPGGKIEVGETVFQALQRELHEELGITIQSATPLLSVKHQYPEKKVCLDVCIVEAFTGIAQGCEQQIIQWIAVNDLAQWQFPEANLPIIDAVVEKIGGSTPV